MFVSLIPHSFEEMKAITSNTDGNIPQWEYSPLVPYKDLNEYAPFVFHGKVQDR